ncbi:hypothetical protein QBC35DRAFT_453229 [Podospora australis]|uniref:HNH nuclease domain-containing protein n=1 Tax=Podospora australis TaxID=1536484 RepID=A0AAN6WSB8_9PEZI|nr:hypothetical protein QBC35DRAFT_453229 [Podospora australis]
MTEDPDDMDDTLENFEALEAMLRMLLQNSSIYREMLEKEGVTGIPPRQKGPVMVTMQERNDLVCPITGTPNAIPTYIIPHCVNDTRFHHYKFRSCYYDAKIFVWPFGGWSIIPLSSELSSYWDREDFGLEYLDSQQGGQEGIPEGFTRQKIRFHWFRVSEKVDPHQKINLDNQNEIPTSIFNSSDNFTYGSLYHLTSHKGEKLSSGYVFFWDVPTETAGKTIRHLELRWTVVQIARMSGAIASPVLYVRGRVHLRRNV